jgi:Ni/Fe-hydrogenase subunit HybB-like protein
MGYGPVFALGWEKDRGIQGNQKYTTTKRWASGLSATCYLLLLLLLYSIKIERWVIDHSSASGEWDFTLLFFLPRFCSVHYLFLLWAFHFGWV